MGLHRNRTSHTGGAFDAAGRSNEAMSLVERLRYCPGAALQGMIRGQHQPRAEQSCINYALILDPFQTFEILAGNTCLCAREMEFDCPANALCNRLNWALEFKPGTKSARVPQHWVTSSPSISCTWDDDTQPRQLSRRTSIELVLHCDDSGVNLIVEALRHMRWIMLV